MKNAKSDTEKPELKIKDREEIANLNQNLYLTYISDRKYMEAIECSDEAIEILSEIYGERSKRLASKMYQRANSLLILNRKPEAIESIDKAIDLHDNPEADKYKPAGSEDAEKEGKGNTAD